MRSGVLCALTLLMPIDESHIRSLATSISDALKSERIGQPVFVRWNERVDSDPGSAAQAALKIVSGWYGGDPSFTHEPEGSELQTTLLAKWPGGQSALLLMTPVGFMDPPALDLAVIGSKGAVYHDV